MREWSQLQGGGDSGGSTDHIGDVMVLVVGVVFYGAALFSAWNSGWRGFFILV
jgi:hypothetical protein